MHFQLGARGVLHEKDQESMGDQCWELRLGFGVILRLPALGRQTCCRTGLLLLKTGAGATDFHFVQRIVPDLGD